MENARCITQIFLLYVCVVIFYQNPLYADWQRRIIGEAPDGIYDLVIGYGRNDDTLRVYGVINGMFKGLYEYTYRGHTQFDRYIIAYGPTVKSPFDLALGTGRNDGINRIYVADWYCIREFSCEGSVWVSESIGVTEYGWRDVAVGAGRNDDTVRVYGVFNFFWFDNNDTRFEGGGIVEYTCFDGVWNIDTVDYDSSNGGYFALTIASGRNDGIKRIYSGTDMWGSSPLYEYTYDSEMDEWDRALVGELSSGSNYARDIKCGAGRNDGIERIYVVNGWPGLIEFSFQNNTWQKYEFGDGVIDGKIDIGRGRNDDTVRVYVTQFYFDYFGDSLFEYTFTDTAWVRTCVGCVDQKADSAYFLNSVVVGEGRNDGRVRVYSGSSELIVPTYEPVACLYEFTYEEEGIEDDIQMSSYDKNILLHNVPNPFNKTTNITYQLQTPCHVSLNIYDITGRIVTKLVDEHKEAGAYTIEWNGTDTAEKSLSNGIYFLCLEVGDSRTTMNIVLMR